MDEDSIDCWTLLKSASDLLPEMTELLNELIKENKEVAPFDDIREDLQVQSILTNHSDILIRLEVCVNFQLKSLAKKPKALSAEKVESYVKFTDSLALDLTNILGHTKTEKLNNRKVQRDSDNYLSELKHTFGMKTCHIVRDVVIEEQVHKIQKAFVAELASVIGYLAMTISRRNPNDYDERFESDLKRCRNLGYMLMRASESMLKEDYSIAYCSRPDDLKLVESADTSKLHEMFWMHYKELRNWHWERANYVRKALVKETLDAVKTTLTLVKTLHTMTDAHGRFLMHVFETE